VKKLRAIIIDDERSFRESLAVLLTAHCPAILLSGLAQSADEGRELLKAQKVDFIFLDISMPDEDGFAFLQSIPKEQYGIIFVTSHEEYSLLALKASAIDYLLKPVDPIELREAVAKAIRHHELRKHQWEVRTIYHQSLNDLHGHVHSENKQIEKITIAEQFGFRVIKVSDLMYLQADSNYTTLQIHGLNKIVATRSLGEFEKMLANRQFFRIHKSTLINMDYLKGYSSYQGYYAEMADGARLPISRRKLNEFREAINYFSKAMD
jgi:two-component system LytT family response regulator